MSAADDLSRRVAEAQNERDAVLRALGMTLGDVREGYAEASMTIGHEMLNGHGAAHGGMIFTLADTAFAYACNSRNQVTVAQQASIAFLTPAGLGERLTARACERGSAGRSGVYEVTVTGEDGRTVAVFQGLSRTVGGPIVSVD